MLDVILDTLIDSVKLVPFLFLTYLAMEYLEHKAGESTVKMVRKAGKLGPFFGGVAGIMPQCGFSAAASNLYAGRVITLGTLIAIYLSTSDEMLPLLISSDEVSVAFILKILGAKAVIGAIAGFVIDLVIREQKVHHHDHAHVHAASAHGHNAIGTHSREGNSAHAGSVKASSEGYLQQNQTVMRMTIMVIMTRTITQNMITFTNFVSMTTVTAKRTAFFCPL